MPPRRLSSTAPSNSDHQDTKALRHEFLLTILTLGLSVLVPLWLNLFRRGDPMALRIDREKNEIAALKAVTSWRGKRVLEIGCGSGRLTRRLASLGPQIDALDPQQNLIDFARLDLPKSYAPRVAFNVGKSSHLQFPKDTFDIAVFAWSL